MSVLAVRYRCDLCLKEHDAKVIDGVGSEDTWGTHVGSETSDRHWCHKCLAKLKTAHRKGWFKLTQKELSHLRGCVACGLDWATTAAQRKPLKFETTTAHSSKGVELDLCTTCERSLQAKFEAELTGGDHCVACGGPQRRGYRYFQGTPADGDKFITGEHTIKLCTACRNGLYARLHTDAAPSPEQRKLTRLERLVKDGKDVGINGIVYQVESRHRCRMCNRWDEDGPLGDNGLCVKCRERPSELQTAQP